MKRNANHKTRVKLLIKLLRPVSNFIKTIRGPFTTRPQTIRSRKPLMLLTSSSLSSTATQVIIRVSLKSVETANSNQLKECLRSHRPFNSTNGHKCNRLASVQQQESKKPCKVSASETTDLTKCTTKGYEECFRAAVVQVSTMARSLARHKSAAFAAQSVATCKTVNGIRTKEQTKVSRAKGSR